MINLHVLNDEQRRAVETLHGPLLVLSGAGTGKTRTVTYRIAHMLDNDISPESILAVTFTNKAAREMKQRVRELVGKKSARLHISTFHSLGVRIIRENRKTLGYHKNITICDANDQRSIIRKILRRISVSWKKYRPEDVLYAIADRRIPGTLKIETGEDHDVDSVVYQNVWKQYRETLKAQNAVDFDDLLHVPLKLFLEHTDVRDAYREKFRYILVDEYQDTNETQFMLVNELAAGHRNLCVVGDDDQSIYGWRGAEVRNILDFEEHYPDAVVVRLEENYRSTGTILAAANAVVKHTHGRKEKELWTRESPGGKIRILGAPDESTEADLVITEIIEDQKKTGRLYSAYAVLMRMNTQARPFEEVLRRYRIPYVVVGGMEFFDRKEIRDFLSYLRVIVNPDDEEAFLRIVNVPSRGAGEKTIERLHAIADARELPLSRALIHVMDDGEIPHATAQQLHELHMIISQARMNMEREMPSHIARDVWQKIEYRRELEKMTQKQEQIENRLACVQTLLDGITQYEGTKPKATLGGYLESIALDSQDDDEELEGNRVALMTIHSSKGLEFPCVYVVGVEKNILPHIKSAESIDGLSEERRLMYVAMTRAKQELTLTYTKARMRFGTIIQCKPSMFIEDIPEDCCVKDDAACEKEASTDDAEDFITRMRDMLNDE